MALCFLRGERLFPAPIGMTTAVVGANTYLFVSGDNKVGVFEIGSDGSLVNRDTVVDDAILQSAPRNVATGVVSGTRRIFSLLVVKG